MPSNKLAYNRSPGWRVAINRVIGACGPIGTSLVLLAPLISALAGCATESLGQGYHIAHVAEANPPGTIEEFAHYTDLYCGFRRLGRVGHFDISPSGRYAALADDGELRLFDRRFGRIYQIIDGAFALPSHFEWDEGGAMLAISYYENYGPSEIMLPVDRSDVPFVCDSRDADRAETNTRLEPK